MGEGLRVALVGYGLAGRVFHAPLIKATPGLTLHTVVSSDAGKVHADLPEVRVVGDPQAAFDDPAVDLIVIASPNATHAPLAIAALQAGKHVIVDKPFALDLAETRTVAAAAADSGRMLSVFHNRRWDADFLALRALIEAGTLGEITEVHSHFDRFRPRVPDRWRERAGPGAGLWLDLGPHLVDQALQLFGLPDAVQADIAIQRAGAEVNDFFHVVLRYPRLRVVLHAGALVPGADLRFAVHGARGSWFKHGLDPQEAALRAGGIPGATGWGVDPAPGQLLRVAADGMVREAPSPSPAGDYRTFYAGIRDAIRDGAPLPVTADEALDVMRVLQAGIDSAASGSLVVPERL
ncbi:oxidoreductase [Luteimonas sp. 3794]|uniref:oxidoreductase n=1 Tax=Luteimonas sp. 3794 TaxID=2817730 RepID=UPI0028671116|nr:oxidoreductase [Luteimonas sp. 3794]MDR6990581.1 putative dehydrogenase [Luteimonas sp. 3794]